MNGDADKSKLLEKVLMKSEALFLSLADRMVDTVAIIDWNGSILFTNSAGAKLAGLESPGDCIGLNIQIFTHPDFCPVVMNDLQLIKNGMRGLSANYRNYRAITRSGEEKWIEGAGSIVHFEGKTAAIVALRDITERKLGEDAIRDSEEKYRSLASTADSMYLIDKSGKYLFMNEGYLIRFGLPWNEIVGSNYGDFHSEEDTRKFTHKVEEVFKSGKSIQHEHKSERDGKYFIRTFSPVKDRDGKATIAITVVSKDITDRRQTEEALQKRESELVKKSLMLEDINTTLSVLLKRRKQDKEELEEKVLANIKELIVPYIDMLKSSRMDERNRAHVDILESNLKNIISPFSQKLSSKNLNLTPKEIRIASLIREGKSTKEMAEILNITRASIDTHRHNIRSKFGLNNKKINLRSYLSSFL